MLYKFHAKYWDDFDNKENEIDGVTFADNIKDACDHIIEDNGMEIWELSLELAVEDNTITMEQFRKLIAAID